MPKKLQKSLQNYLSKIKNHNPPLSFPSNSFSSSKSWVQSACRHPKTLSFAIDCIQEEDDHDRVNNEDDAATLADVDSFLFENFGSLYRKDDEDQDRTRRELGREGSKSKQNFGPILLESPRFIDPPTNLCGSHRFFMEPGISGSLMEEARISRTSTMSGKNGGSSSTSTVTINEYSTNPPNNHLNNDIVSLPDDCIAILKNSQSPYDDFRTSMREMVEDRLNNHEQVDWEFMEELLFYYLNLNEKKSYKFIISAFVDLVVVLRNKSERSPAPRMRNGRSVRTSGGSSKTRERNVM